ncbi:MAG TPA: CehA/McbA family metallohydrolase [Aggregatilineales bacterium]|nr:CehA/McbA family metallohydrolase [Aggregatilineales bacterium]
MRTLYEYAGNLHMHTTYSDGAGTHAEIARAAVRAGLDFVVVTDHNVWVDGLEGYYGDAPGQRVLLLVGEEVHDVRRQPQANHLLAYGAERELATYAPDPQALIDEINASEGLSFLAHPVERAAPLFDEPALPWVDWEIEGYTGLELWNYMSEFKSYAVSRAAAARAALTPDRYISGPFPETLALWDRLLREGRRVKVIGGADTHATPYSMGPITREIFPYEYLFRCVNTHILSTRKFTGDYEHDKPLVMQALRDGRCFVGYDLPHPTTGFRFTAQGHNFDTVMGGWIRLGHGVTLQAVSPIVADMRLFKDGKMVMQETSSTHRTYIASEPGAYRVEVHIEYKGKLRGWIYSNPIFIVP